MTKRHYIFSIIILAIIVLFIAVFGIYKSALTTAAGTGEAKIFVVDSGEGASKIGSELKNAGLIKSKWVFIIHLVLNRQTGGIKAGTYLISPRDNMLKIIDELTGGKVAVKRVTIPEGLTIPKIGDQLQSANVVSKNDFMRAVKEKYAFSFLSGAPKASGLEGYLFPDTYFFPYAITADSVVKTMLLNFENRVVSSSLPEQFKKEGLSLHQAVTLASIVELEAKTESDRKIVAGIFLNRLRLKMPLESDATVNYITGKSDRSPSLADTKIDSPYNTYAHSGLPPGPVSAPGIVSLTAVASPTPTNYLYFCSEPGGTVHYARTFAEHRNNLPKCLAE